jgi:hypothetical protein
MTRPPPDLGLLRFLRAGHDDAAVLNPAPAAPAGPHPPGTADLGGRLLRAARALLPDRAGVPYTDLARSPAFAAYRALTAELHRFDPATLTGRQERTAFWINLYNALVIDAVISFGVRASIREVPGFFHRAAYRVGPYRLALDEIEHGLLRANRPPFPRLPLPLPPGDPRAALGPGVLDPRVHFALNCGTRSCPPVAFYAPERLDAQLDAAAAAFINGEGVRLEGDEAVLSPLFDFYAEDFGGRTGAISWVLRYLSAPDLRRPLLAGRVRSGRYDWSLNGC